MSREIKFRGYSELDQGWVYGLLVVNTPTQCHRIVSDFSLVRNAKHNKDGLHHCGGDFSIVDSKSVGQYTGLKDKNGKEIYEDDLLKDCQGLVMRVYSVDGGFAVKAPYWAMELGELSYTDHLVLMPLAEPQTVSYVSDSVEVIGNIHENPELLNQPAGA